jgi:peptide deformylase
VNGRELAGQVEQLLSRPAPWPIVQAGHPVLRVPCSPYDGGLDERTMEALLAGMRTTMREAPGVGLAAPQIGLGVAIAVVEDPGATDDDVARVRERDALPFRVLVNPSYTPVGDARVGFYEGCLSVVGWQAVTPRWRSVRLTCTDEHGHPVDEVLTGWAARIVQHETDHLRGRLYIDVAEPRSLVSDRMAVAWAFDPSPERAAAALGFELP